MRKELLKLMDLQGQSVLLGKKAFDSIGYDKLIALYDLLQLQEKVVEGLGRLLYLEKELSSEIESLRKKVDDLSHNDEDFIGLRIE